MVEALVGDLRLDVLLDGRDPDGNINAHLTYPYFIYSQAYLIVPGGFSDLNFAMISACIGTIGR